LNEAEVAHGDRHRRPHGHLDVKKSRENQLFLDYIRTLNSRKKEGDVLKEKYEAATDPIGKAGLKGQMEDLDKSMKAYQQDLIDKNPGTFVSSIVRMSMPTPDDRVTKPDGSLDSLGHVLLLPLALLGQYRPAR
jgi:hypothetical protein